MKESRLPAAVTQMALPEVPPNATQFVYQVPQENTEGQVQIIAMGWTEIRTHADETAKIPALHIRFIALKKIADQAATDQSWSVDVRLQQIRFAGFDDAVRPLFVYSISSTLPYVRVADGAQVAVDLYYPLPAPLALAAQHVPLPKFELRWSVLTSLQGVSETTELVKLYPEEPTTSVYPNLIPKKLRNAKMKVPALVKAESLTEEKGSWWQDPFGETPPAFSTMGVY